MQDHIFRLYDIRGKVGDELTLANVYQLGRALSTYFLSHKPKASKVVVGMDGRTHSPEIKKELCRALCDSGLSVVFLGVIPTPVMYFALHNAAYDAGLMITASHNDASYNGIKICLGTESVWGTQISAIRDLYKNNSTTTSENNGSYQEDFTIIDSYISYLEKHFAHLKGCSLPIVFDCGNGATGAIMPALLERLDFQQSSLLYQEVDGTFPHHEADPTVAAHVEDLKRVMRTKNAALGIGFDGDGDRMAPVTQQGQLISGDRLLALFAETIKYPENATIVFDIKCSQTLSSWLQQKNMRAVMVPSGHAIIKHEMKQRQAVLGGELSCHFFFHDRYFGYDDGIYAALRLIELLVEKNRSLDELIATLPITHASPEFRFFCAEEQKPIVVSAVLEHFSTQTDAEVVAIDGVRAQFPESWGLVRASNTQPAICIRCEATTPQGLALIKKELGLALGNYLPSPSLEALLKDEA